MCLFLFDPENFEWELFWEASSHNCCLFKVSSFVFLRVTEASLNQDVPIILRLSFAFLSYSHWKLTVIIDIPHNQSPFRPMFDHHITNITFILN